MKWSLTSKTTGHPKHVFKRVFSVRGFGVDFLFIFSAEKAEAFRKAGLDDSKLSGTERRIDMGAVEWIARAKQKYGNDWQVWMPGPLPALQIIRHGDTTYVLGSNPYAERDQSTEVYVFQVLPRMKSSTSACSIGCVRVGDAGT